MTCSIILVATIGVADEPTVQAVRQGGLGDLQTLIETTRRAWAYAEDKHDHFGVDLDQLSTSAEAQIRNCTNKNEAFEVLRGVVAGLKDGHASLRLPDQGSSPDATGRIKGRLHDSREGLVYDRQLVLQWNGQTTDEAIKSLLPRVFASTPGMARQLAIRKLQYGRLNEPIHVKLKSLDGAEEERTLKIEPEKKAEAAPLELRRPEKEIAYLAIRSFDVRRSGWGVKTDGPLNASGLSAAAVEAVQKKISAAFKECEGARALILDLRGNMGGTDSLGSYAALHLVPGEFCYFKLQTRFSPELKNVRGFADSPESGWSQIGEGWKPPRPAEVKPFGGFVWVLFDELCFSTTDNLLACLRDLLPPQRARFLGRPSGGGTGAPRVLATLPFTGAQLTLTVMKVYSPHDRLIEGRGTIPDREIVWTWQDVAENRDPDLEAALSEARAKLHQSTP